MKKIGLLFMASALVFGVFAGCSDGGDDVPNPPTEDGINWTTEANGH